MWQARHRSEHSEPTTHLHRDNGSFSFIWAGTQPWATVPKKLSWKQRTGTGRFIQQSWGGQVPWTTLRHTGHRFKGCQRHKQCRSLSATFVGSERRSFCRYNHTRLIQAVSGDFMEAIVQEMCLEINILLFKINENRAKVNKKSHIFSTKNRKIDNQISWKVRLQWIRIWNCL